MSSLASGGIYRVAPHSTQAQLQLTPSRPLFHTDGMLRYGKNFLLIEGQGRLDLMSVHGDSVSVETLKEGYSVPTGVTPVGKTAWVSEGQFGSLGNSGPKPNLPFHVYSVELPAAQ